MKSIARTIAFTAFFIAPILASAQIVQTTNTGYSVGVVSSSGGFTSAQPIAQPSFSTGSCTAGIGCVASTILYIINAILVPVLFALAFIVFLYGVAKSYIFSHGESGEVEEGHKLILWGIIGFVVMISLWGLVNVVSNTFGLTGSVAPTLPRSQI